MSLKSEFANRISYLLRRRQFDRELAAEMQFHIETRAGEETRAAWQIAWIEDLIRDLRYCARSLGRSPGFAAAAILSLAFGIGANTTVFSIVKAVLLGSLPMRGADRLASFQQAGGAARFSYPDFEDYRRQVTPRWLDLSAAAAVNSSVCGGNW